jgi:CBS domain-containing protein
MLAKDVMTSPVLTVKADVPIKDVARLLLERHISAVPVVDEGGLLIGVVSEGDLMRRPESGTERHPSWWLSLLSDPEDEARQYLKSHGMRAGDVMTRHVVTVPEDTPLHDIADLLERHRIKRVPVVREGKVVGIVSRANLLQALVVQPRASEVAADDRSLRDAVIDAIQTTGARTPYVNVVVSGGVAHVWGLASSQFEKDAIRVAAEQVAGVKEVQERITLMPRGADHAV